MLAALAVDAVWLMGVRGAESRRPRDRAGRARAACGLPRALPDLRQQDVIGSPPCVRDYLVDERFRGPDGLAAAREQLADRDLALVLDYVPNHAAADHPWVTDRPGCFLGGN